MVGFSRSVEAMIVVVVTFPVGTKMNGLGSKDDFFL